MRRVPVSRCLRLTALLLLVATACTPVVPATPAPTAQPAPALQPAPELGVHTFVWGQPQTTARDLHLASDAGLRWQKSLFPWREIEPVEKGRFEWAEADRVVQASAEAGLNVIARLDFQPTWARRDHAHNGPPDDYRDYWDFVSAFVTRYRGRVQAIEVWNEPNLDREWGNQPISRESAADYVRLLGGAYSAAHAADPNIIVLSAGLSPTGVTDPHSADDVEYLKWMYAAGLKGKFDALGAHANAQAPEPTAAFGSLKDFPHPSFYFRRVEQLRDVMVDNADGARKIWLLEWGWTSDTQHAAYRWFAVSEEKKADNILTAVTYAREHWSAWMGVMSIWTLADPTWGPDREEFWWAITNPDGTPRPAYTRLRDAHVSTSTA